MRASLELVAIPVVVLAVAGLCVFGLVFDLACWIGAGRSGRKEAAHV